MQALYFIFSSKNIPLQFLFFLLASCIIYCRSQMVRIVHRNVLRELFSTCPLWNRALQLYIFHLIHHHICVTGGLKRVWNLFCQTGRTRILFMRVRGRLWPQGEDPAGSSIRYWWFRAMLRFVLHTLFQTDAHKLWGCQVILLFHYRCHEYVSFMSNLWYKLGSKEHQGLFTLSPKITFSQPGDKVKYKTHSDICKTNDKTFKTNLHKRDTKECSSWQKYIALNVINSPLIKTHYLRNTAYLSLNLVSCNPLTYKCSNVRYIFTVCFKDFAGPLCFCEAGRGRQQLGHLSRMCPVRPPWMDVACQERSWAVSRILGYKQVRFNAHISSGQL